MFIYTPTALASTQHWASWKDCPTNSLGFTSNKESLFPPILWMVNRGPVTHGMNIITDEILLLWKPRPLISYAIVFLSHPQIKELVMAPFNLYFTLCGKLRSLFGLGQFTLEAGGWKRTRQGCSSTTGLPKMPLADTFPVGLCGWETDAVLAESRMLPHLNLQ